MAPPLTMIENATIRDIEKELARLREEVAGAGGPPALRTSSATHIAWVPERWEAAARAVQAGLAQRHPSRLIILFPSPETSRDELDADVDVVCFGSEGLGREVCAEVIELRLNGPRASAPASVVLPLLISDLPVFLRWRGEPPFGEEPFEQLVAVIDRLIVDSDEWDDPAAGLASLARCAGHTVISDLAWTRTEPWRQALAALWPAVAQVSRVRVAGPEAEALLLVHWLGARLDREIELDLEPAAAVTAVEVDGLRVPRPPADERTPADLLSAQLESFGRERIYEEALGSFAPGAG